MLISLLLIFLVLFFIHATIRYTRAGRLIDKIPGPTPLPIFGNLFDFNLTAEEVWNVIRENAVKYYPMGKVWIGHHALVGIRCPDYIKVILTKNRFVSKSYFYKFIKPVVKDGLFTSAGNKWKSHRRLLDSAFHKDMFESYVQIANEHINNMIRYIKSHGDETVQDIIPISKDLALNIISEATMNVNLHDIGAKEDNYKHAMDDFMDLIAYRTFRPYLTDWAIKFLNVGRRQNKIIEIIHKYGNEIIKKRKDYHESKKLLRNSVDNTSVTEIDESIESKKNKRSVTLDILLSGQKNGMIDEEGVLDEVNTSILAGYHTTALAFVYTLMLLAENKETQDLARSEVFKVLDESDGEITTIEIKKLDYVERCVKEALRLYPSVPHVLRHLHEDIELDTYTIPSGLELAVSIFDVHRDPKYWPNPNKFDPDRFLPEHIKNRHPFAYIPFSAGARNCLGQKFAMMELTCAVARILHNFYLEPVDATDNLQFKVNVILAPTHPIHMKFIKLDKSDYIENVHD